MRKFNPLTPFGKAVKIELMENEITVCELAEKVRATGIGCYDQQLSKCLHGTLHNEKILNAVSQITGIQRSDAV